MSATAKSLADAAKTAREQAEKWTKMPDPQDPEQTADRLTWQQRLEVDVLRRELDALLPPAGRSP